MNLSPLPIQKFFNNNGDPLVGGLLYTYTAGTTTKVATYTDSTGVGTNTNPIELDYRGECRVWLDVTKTYKFVLSPAGDTDPPTKAIWTVDNIAAPISFADLTQQIIGFILFPRTAAEIVAGVTPLSYFYFAQPQIYLDRYGADPTGAAFSDTALANALLVIAQKGGGTILLDGTYKFANSYSLGESTIIQGSGMLETKLTYTGTGDFITLGNTSARCVLRDLWLDGTSKLGVGLRIGGTDFSGMHTITKIRVRNFATGIRLAGALWTTIQDSFIDGNGRGIDFNAGGASLYSTTVELLRNRISSNDNEGIAATSVPVRLQTISVRGGSIEGNCTSSPGTTSQHVTGQVEQLKIDNVYYEYTPGGTKPNAIDINGASNFEIQAFVNGARTGITATSANDGIISATRFLGCTANDVFLSGGVNVARIELRRNTYGGTNVLAGVNVYDYTNDQQNTSFTPTIKGATTAGAPTYTSQFGSYSRIGNVVTFQLRVSITAKGGMLGAISVEGLPTARATLAGVTSVFAAEYSGITVSGGNTYLYAELASGTTSLLLYQGGSTSNAQLTDTNLAAATTVQISGSYSV
jgi:hypothetical protein